MGESLLNINSVAGFKFQEVKSVILQGLFDIVILAETKIDAGFPDSQFYLRIQDVSQREE